MPDDELLAAAGNHTLAQPGVLHAQVERLLNDSRSRAFVHNFTGQWLDLRNIDADVVIDVQAERAEAA